MSAPTNDGESAKQLAISTRPILKIRLNRGRKKQLLGARRVVKRKLLFKKKIIRVTSSSSDVRTRATPDAGGDSGLVSSEVIVARVLPVVHRRPLLDKLAQRDLNKKLRKALTGGRGDDVARLMEAGGSVAYQNYDGINTAAEKGKLKTFQGIFEKLDYRRYIDGQLIRDLMEAAEEDGHNELHRYLSNYEGNCLEKIPDENMAGFEDDGFNRGD